MSLFRITSKRIGAIFLVSALLGSGLVFADEASAVTQVQPKMECIYMGGYQICGSAQYLVNANIAGQNVINTMAANKTKIGENGCAQISAVTTVLGVLIIFMPESAIIDFVMGSIAGFSIAEIQECLF